ncbi:hypothetical protein GY45DRAFT_1375902 [Cubamyces sp. BRFM 1775]|nr:hypothetical protein GY45DRAFT_1375902 [Cubamyces sp. BRFM 1775]
MPVSDVVGFSIPTTSGAGAASAPVPSVAASNRSVLLNLLNNGPPGSSAGTAAPMKIWPRGLVLTGNMCLANSVLWILVYRPSFHRFFSERRKHLAGIVVGSQREDSKATPLVDAAVHILKEFVPDPPASNRAEKAKDKEREDHLFDELDSFIPTYVYDAIKEKKSLARIISLSPKQSQKTAGEGQTQGGEWLEVGKKNKAVTTRINLRWQTRIPHQRDSVTIEGWRSLQWDIQPENVKTLEDALQHISHPQQQVLIEALSPVLILHMKRFLYDAKVDDVVKVSKQVAFPPKLEMGFGMAERAASWIMVMPLHSDP